MNDDCFIQQKLELYDGDHLKFLTNSSSLITTVNIVKGSKLNSIPYGIFKTFTELKKLLLEESGIKIIQPDCFVDGRKLTFLSLRNNEIRIIPSNVFLNLSSLEEADLTKNSIELIKDNAFNGMDNLQDLQLNDNRIRFLSRWAFAGAPNIRILHLSNNEIERIDEGALRLPKLRILYLIENKLKKLPDELFIGAPSLEMIYADRNEITHIGSAFNKCDKLAILSLNNNPIQDVHLPNLASLDNLDMLFLDNIKFNFSSEKPANITSKSKLKTLMINNNGLTDPDIFNHLSIFGQLEEIFAINNSFSYFHDIDKVKSYFPNLKMLNLARNQPSLCSWINENKEWITGIIVSSSTDEGDSCPE